MANPNLTLRNNPYQAPTYYYPLDLGGEGQEPYVIFDIRDGVAKNAQSKGTVALMLPPEVRTSYAASYEDVGMGIAGGYNPTVSPSAGMKAIRDAASEFSKNTVTAIKNKFETVSEGVVDTAYATALNTSARLQRDFRTIVNPHMAVLFKGMGFRVFSLSFSLVARNVEESNMIRNIIYTFKYHMHPSFPKDTTNRFLLYPENFVIAFYSPSPEYLFRISPCVLESMSVDYNGSSVPAFYSDTGAPVHITMSLQFKETECLTKERLTEGM